MTKLLAISGSLRAGSFNTALMRAAIDLAPDGVEITEGSIQGIPLYNGDDEAQSGVPESAVRLQDQIAKSDGILLFTPEYNNGVPGVLKNAVDWVSRPSKQYASNVFTGKPIAITGASPGYFGTVLAQLAWLPTLRLFGMRPWLDEKLTVSNASAVFKDGKIVDEATSKNLSKFVSGFAEYAAKERAK